MPVAGPSRRSTNNRRRDPSSDGIEADEPTQRHANHEDVDEEEDEEERPRRAKAGKKEKTTNTAAPQEQDEDEDSDPLENFGDQPLDKAQAQRIAGVASDWNMIRRNHLAPFYGIIKDVATVFAEFTEGEKGENLISEMDGVVRQLIDSEAELLAHEKALNDLNQKVSCKEPITDVVDQYEQDVKRRANEYKEKTTRQKYATADEYFSFRQAVFEVQNPEIAMPPVTDFLQRGGCCSQLLWLLFAEALFYPEDGDESDDDDDLVMGGVTQDYKCPLTLTILVDPLTSKLCGHSFSKTAIEEYLGSRYAQKECPASGCTKMLTLSNLEPNKELARKARDAGRRERMREQDSDEEDVVESVSFAVLSHTIHLYQLKLPATCEPWLVWRVNIVAKHSSLHKPLPNIGGTHQQLLPTFSGLGVCTQGLLRLMYEYVTGRDVTTSPDCDTRYENMSESVASNVEHTSKKRRAEMDKPPSERTTIKHEDFWLSDGNIILAADNEDENATVLYKCHRSMLARHSPVFKDMFDLPQPVESQEEIYGISLLRLHDKPKDVESLLRAIHDPMLFALDKFASNAVDLLGGAIKLSTKYEMDSLRADILQSDIQTWMRRPQIVKQSSKGAVFQDPGECYVLPISEARIPEALRAAFYELHRLYDGRGHTRICRVNDLTTGDLHRLVMGRERLRMVVTAILTDDSLYEDELYAMHFATVDFNGSKEICRKHVEDWWDKKAERLAFDDLALLNDPFIELNRLANEIEEEHTLMCSGCAGEVSAFIRSSRKELWDSLDRFFDLTVLM
ncbi:hypothetical protein IEO21_07824 [Rhodonia placenta]|uniref:SP-RING-type domain-containing protein n=1 Tax=Rhodonia placenta TaxID=104341 RepID=A0A8H7U000_9APHY|nr:hypothetical protein IEO21_07824 [Postia placenta]